MSTYKVHRITALTIGLSIAAPAGGCSSDDRQYGETGGGGGSSTGAGALCEPGSTAPCYSGPASTEGVGSCKAGVKACAADGASYSECAGEVLPKQEWCVAPADEDCNGDAPACLGTPVWAAKFGDSAAQEATNVFVDKQGNVLLVGYLYGSVNFGGGPLTSAGGDDIFVAKFSPDGALLWGKRFGDVTGDQQRPFGVTADADGNVLVTGIFMDSADFGGGSLVSAGAADMFLVKLDPNGAHVWSRRFGDAASWQWGERITTDSQGNVLVTGTMAGTLELGGEPLIGAGQVDVFVAKFSADGAHVWSKRFGDDANQSLGLIAVDHDDNVIVSFPLYGAFDAGGGPLTSPGAEDDVALIKLAPDGKHLWSQRFGDSGAQEPRGLAVDAEGSIVVSGQFTGGVDFGGGALSCVGAPDIFVAKFGPNGVHSWSRRFGDAELQGGMRIAIDNAGSIVATGHFMGSIDFGGPALTSAGLLDIFAVKLDSKGNYVWSERFGDADDERSSGIAIGVDGSTFITGGFDGSVNWGNTLLTSAGAKDIFLAKLAP